jgi:hypothetical protein
MAAKSRKIAPFLELAATDLQKALVIANNQHILLRLQHGNNVVKEKRLSLS